MENIYNNTTFLTESSDYENFPEFQYYMKVRFIIRVVTYIIISIGLPLDLVAIYALYSLVRKDHVAPIYVINLLISDLIQFCCMIALESQHIHGIAYEIVYYFYCCGLVASVCFMMCVSLERYLVVTHPLWYRFKRTIKTSVIVCVVVWVISPICCLIVCPWVDSKVPEIIFSVFLIIPLPLFIFCLVGTLRALSASVSVPSEEKRRIVGILVLVLLTYTLLFLPSIISYQAEGMLDNSCYIVSLVFVRLSPLADLVLYFLIRKDAIGQFLASVCCCKIESNDNNTSTVNVDNI
ncbi:G-protein coupled receptor 4-like [Notolabrus celidotus]|uniref:G-protein coupled receptor 4-like n=1 Tax=Notolabrus celidotus TaxID=1203425 RepID=UPI00148F8D83|nr:G-protein coupled receptor 4-like [Notolabrus celidotus]